MSASPLTVRGYRFRSAHLAETRGITVFLPPKHNPNRDSPVLFCADGQAIHGFSKNLTDQMASGHIPPIVLIGAHSSPQARGPEYVLGTNPQKFDAHERFFLEELIPWADSEFRLSAERTSRGVFGFSNGGAFSLAMGTRHRDQFGIVIAFSIAGGADRIEEAEYVREPALRYYLSAGTREKPFRDTARALARLLSKHKVEHIATERCAGHDFDFWNSELAEAIRWAYAANPRAY